MAAIQQTAEMAVRNFLKQITRTQSQLSAVDDGTAIHLSITINHATGSADFDLTGADPETYSNRNAPASLVYSAVIYCMRTSR